MPGAADRIFKMAEEQAEHRRQMEGFVIQHGSRFQKAGQTFGLIAFLTTVGAALACFYLGKDAAGYGILGLDMLGVLRALAGRFGKSESKE